MKENKRFLLYLVIIILFAATLRMIGFSSLHRPTFDELLYAKFGDKLSQNPFNYTSQDIYEVYLERGYELPDYLNQPLFKHPPFYSYLIALTYVVYKPAYAAAVSISLIFGLILIFITYLMAKFIYDGKTALLAALLISIEPIHWICSEKIWMETALAALMWITLYFLIRAIKEPKTKFFVLAGIFSGLSLLTKYPAFLVFPIGINLILLFRKELLNLSKLWLWPLITIALFLPWIIWNLKVYGVSFFLDFFPTHGFNMGEVSFPWIWLIILFLCIVVLIVCLSKIPLYTEKKEPSLRRNNKFLFYCTLLFLGLFFSHPYMLRGLINTFDIFHVPVHGWIIGMFGSEPLLFYLRRLIELSPFFLLSFFSLFLIAKPNSKERFLFIPFLWGILFYIVWGNYQSRYVLFCVPPLLILTSHLVILSFEKLDKNINSKALLLIAQVALGALFFFFFLKTIIIDLVLALPNKTCYF